MHVMNILRYIEETNMGNCMGMTLKSWYFRGLSLLCNVTNPLSPAQDCTLKRNELMAIRTQTEREALEKRKLDDSVMEKMMQRLTMDKATQYTRKSVDKLRKTTEELVSCITFIRTCTQYIISWVYIVYYWCIVNPYWLSNHAAWISCFCLQLFSEGVESPDTGPFVVT